MGHHKHAAKPFTSLSMFIQSFTSAVNTSIACTVARCNYGTITSKGDILHCTLNLSWACNHPHAASQVFTSHMPSKYLSFRLTGCVTSSRAHKVPLRTWINVTSDACSCKFASLQSHDVLENQIWQHLHTKVNPVHTLPLTLWSPPATRCQNGPTHFG